MNRTAVAWRQMAARLAVTRWRVWLWATLAGLAVAAAWLLVWAAGTESWGSAGRLALVPVGVAAAWAAWSVWNRPLPAGHRRGRLQFAWLFLALALTWWSVAHLLAALSDTSTAGPGGQPTLADLARLVGWACAMVALAAYPPARGEHFGGLRLTLDILVVAGAVATVGWLAVVRPIVGDVAGGFQTGWVVAHVTADLAQLILLVVVFQAMPAGANGPPLLLLGAGLAARLAADATAAQATTVGLVSTPGSNLGWMAALVLAGTAAWVQRQSLTQAMPLGTGERGRRAQVVIKMALPLIATLAVSWYVLIDIRNTGQPDLLGLTVAVLLALVLVTRQGVMAGELELRQYAHLVNSGADPAFVCDGTGRLRLVNPALLTVTGYAMEALLGQPATMLFAQGRLPLGEGERPERVFVTGWTGEVNWRRRDGTLFPAHLSLRPVPSDYPTRPGLVGTAHDLSEQKRHEATLVAAYEEVAQARRALEDLNTQLEAIVEEKTGSLSDAYERLARQHETLQTLDKLKSEFVSLVSHELRAPLTNIGGGIELVLAGGGELAPKARRALQLVQSEITRLTQFVETILDLSALEAGRLPLYPAPLDIRPMLATVLAQFEARPGADRLRVEWPEELAPVLADERALESVLFHLVDNALKYAPQGEVMISAVAAGSRVEVSVSDRGPGIPPDQVETIFEKFERLDDTDNRDVYGHGLGLYMARRLLEAQGGGIRAATRPEGGARLTCWVPIVEANDAE